MRLLKNHYDRLLRKHKISSAKKLRYKSVIHFADAKYNNDLSFVMKFTQNESKIIMNIHFTPLEFYPFTLRGQERRLNHLEVLRLIANNKQPIKNCSPDCQF